MTHTSIRAWHINDNGTRVGYLGFFKDLYHLQEIFQRHGIHRYNLVQPLKVNDKEVAEHRINELFDKLESLPPRIDQVPEVAKVTRKQEKELRAAGVDLKEWTVLEDENRQLKLVHPVTGELKVVSA